MNQGKQSCSWPGFLAGTALGLALILPRQTFAQGCNPDEDTSIPRIFLIKRLSYSQTGESLPIVDPWVGAAFGAFAVPGAGAGFTSASLTTPSAVTETLFRTPEGPHLLFKTFGAELELETGYPPGAYKINVGLPDRNAIVQLAQKPMSVVVAPQVTNLNALQAADPQTDITVRFNGINQPAPGDTISFSVERFGDDVFFIPNSCQQTVLSHSSTSLIIPKGTLLPNTLYHATLAFVKQSSADHSISGIPATAGNSKVTAFQIFTGGIGTPPRAPEMVEAHFNSDGSFHLTFIGAPNQKYAVLSKQALSDNWTPRVTLTSQDGVLSFDDTQATAVSTHFYSARIEP